MTSRKAQLCLAVAAGCLAAISFPTSASAEPGRLQLLPGYQHVRLQGIDSIVGEIVKPDGLRISYEQGMLPKPGQPEVGGMFRDGAKHMPKAKRLWYREQTVQGQRVHLAMRNDEWLIVSFPQAGMNFSAKIESPEQLVDALLMILTYAQ